MNNRKTIMCLVFLLLNTLMLHAQDSYWDMDIHQYQYDMSIYGALLIGGSPVNDYSNYEIAAFVGDECRGVGKMQSATENGKTYSWVNVRARSNSQSDETITFKAYDKTQNRVFNIQESVAFASNAVVGFPSAPMQLTIQKAELGDANGDERITISDVVVLVNYIFGLNPDNFIVEVADVNEDGRITISDVVTLVNTIFNR